MLDVGGRRRFPNAYKQLIVYLDCGVITILDISVEDIKTRVNPIDLQRLSHVFKLAGW